MSSSPKYTRARLREEMERRLREERKRQAELARARQKAREEQKRRERLVLAQSTATAKLTEIQRIAERFFQSALAKFAQKDQQRQIQEQLRQIEISISQAQNEHQVGQASKRLRQIQNDLRQIELSAESAQFASHLAEESDVSNRLKQKIAEMDQNLAQKFDSQGRKEVTDSLKQVESFLSRKDLSKARQKIGSLRHKLEQHQTNVSERFSAWLEKKEKTETALAEAKDRMESLVGDEVVMRWASKEVNTLQQKMNLVTSQIHAEQFEKSQQDIVAWLQEAEQISSQAQELQIKEDRRQYIVSGIVKTMQKMGFIVQSGSPSLEYPGIPNSSMIIQAQRLGGGAIGVSVPQDGEIWYDVDGFPMRIESNGKGQQVKTCDQAEQEIEKMHEAMEDAFGIEMSEFSRWKISICDLIPFWI